jgi:hypothetical protein
VPKLLCPKCQCEFKPKTNGVAVVEMAGNDPYKLWYSDLWSCPGCDAEVVTPFLKPLAEHFERDFGPLLARAKRARRIVYDFEKPQSPNGEAPAPLQCEELAPPAGLCQHCGEEIADHGYRVMSKEAGIVLVDMVVCKSCGDEAKRLNLQVKEIR